jgi:hypothetical protein
MANKYVRRSDGTNSSIPQDIEFVVGPIGATQAVDSIVWQAAVPCKLVGVSGTFSTTSTSGTLQVEVCPVGTAAGSGTDQLTGTMSLAGTAGVSVAGTVIAAPTAINAGDRIALDFGGTVTNLVNLYVTLRFKRLQSANSNQ